MAEKKKLGPQLSIDEIVATFDAEWVLIGNPRTTAHHEVRGGRVLYHSKNRAEVYAHAARMKPGRYAVLYAGQPACANAILL